MAKKTEREGRAGRGAGVERARKLTWRRATPDIPIDISISEETNFCAATTRTTATTTTAGERITTTQAGSLLKVSYQFLISTWVTIVVLVVVVSSHRSFSLFLSYFFASPRQYVWEEKENCNINLQRVH